MEDSDAEFRQVEQESFRALFRENAHTTATPLRGESQMAVTAIDHGGAVITITSQLLESASSANPTMSPTFVTSVHGAALVATVWQAKS